MVDILKSKLTSFPFSSCLVMFSMVHELNCNMIKACFRDLWMMMSTDCKTLVQLAEMNNIKIF